MEKTDYFSTLIEQHLSAVNFCGTPDELYQPIRYILCDGGKRMRPMLCLLGASVFTDDVLCAMDAALAVEVFHNFTLLHDDIMDSAPTRRGRPTVHCKWDSNRAILSGDAMMILSYSLLARSVRLDQQFAVFNRAALEVCEGQQLDIEFERMDSVSMEQYLNMIRLKTASLMAAAMKIGAIAGGGDSQQCDQLYRYGENLGFAFQIQDDLLDTYGNSATFGKQIGGDIAEGKQTFLRIAAFSRCGDNEAKVLRESRDYTTVRAIYDELDVADEAQKAINHYFERAAQCLDGLPADKLHPIEYYGDTLLRRKK